MQTEVASDIPDPADDLSAPPSFYLYIFIINLEPLTWPVHCSFQLSVNIYSSSSPYYQPTRPPQYHTSEVKGCSVHSAGPPAAFHCAIELGRTDNGGRGQVCGEFVGGTQKTHSSAQNQRYFMNATISDTAVMNQIPTTSWSPMVSAPEEDFASFLEFEDLQLQFPNFDGVVQDGRELQQEPTETMDTPMGNEQGLMRLEDGNMPQDMDQGNSMQNMNGFQGSTSSYHNLNIHSDLYTPIHQQQMHIHAPRQYHGQNMIPPTPNSIEMHGDHTQYYRPSGDHQAQAVYESFGRNPQKDQVRIPNRWKYM